MRKEQAVEERPSAKERIEMTPDERSAMYYPEDSSMPRHSADGYASEWHQRQRTSQRFSEQDSYDMYDGRRTEDPQSPRDPREPNNNQQHQPRTHSPSNRRSWRSYPNRTGSSPPNDRWTYHSRRPRYSREEQMRYWERSNRYEMPLAYEEVRPSERRHHRGPSAERGRRPQTARRRPVREDVWKRSRAHDKFMHLHDTIERLNAELMASQEQRYLLEKENADLELDLEEFRVKSLRTYDSLRKQDKTVEKMTKKILMLEDKIVQANEKLCEREKEVERFQMEAKQLRSERDRLDEKIRKDEAEYSRERDELNDKLKKTTSQLTLLWKEQAKLQLVNDANRDLKHQIKIMKEQYQGKEIYEEPSSRRRGQNDSLQATNLPTRKKNISDQPHSVAGRHSSMRQDLDEGKFAKQEIYEKNLCSREENSRLVDEKVSDSNIDEENKSTMRYEVQPKSNARNGSFIEYADSSTRLRDRGPSEERETIEEPTPRGRSPVARYGRHNYQNSSVRRRARSQAEPPRWFCQMDRYARDDLEQFFAQADKHFSGDPEGIKHMLQNRFGFDTKQCGDIYNYFMWSDFVYRSGRWSPCSTGRYQNRSPARNSSNLNSLLHGNSGPRKYDGPLKGRDNTFWVKFRNPHLKEEIEAAQGPVLTPTQTPDTSPEPEASSEKRNE